MKSCMANDRSLAACRVTGGSALPNLRAYYTFMFGHPGKKLLFMGCSLLRSGNEHTITAWTGICCGKLEHHGSPGAGP